MDPFNYNLKPCPFCGGRAGRIERRTYVTTGWQVQCTACRCATPPVWINSPVSFGDGVDESTRYTSDQAAQIAADKWNRRAEKCD